MTTSASSDGDYLQVIVGIKQDTSQSSPPDPEIVAMLRKTFEELCEKGKFSEAVLNELQQLTPAQIVEALRTPVTSFEQRCLGWRAYFISFKKPSTIFTVSPVL